MQVVRRALQTSSHTGTLPHPEQFRLFVTNFFTMSSQFDLGMNVVLTALVLMHRVDDLALRKQIERKIEMQPFHLVFLSSVLTAIKVSVHRIIIPFFYQSFHIIGCPRTTTSHEILFAMDIKFDYRISTTQL
jgi:hypothetical protein